MDKDNNRSKEYPGELTKSIVGNVHYVSDNVMHCWGSGSSPEEAIADYEANLIETYEDLSNGAEPLSRLAEDRLNIMNNRSNYFQEYHEEHREKRLKQMRKNYLRKKEERKRKARERYYRKREEILRKKRESA